MEGNFEKMQIPCLDVALHQVQNSEQTMEIKLQEGMPDVGQVLAAWGQPVLRSKEWRDDSVQFSGGMMIWVLYTPEKGEDEQCIHGWIPFQMRWELPENTSEGAVQFHCLTRFVDGRSTSPRKILVRAGMAVLADAYTPVTLETAAPVTRPDDVAFLENTYPLRLIRETGEKIFPVEESLRLPDAAPDMDSLIYWRICPQIHDQRVLGDKAVMRGNSNLHVLYRSTAGQMHAWDFEVPFSQYTDLRAEYGNDARIDLTLVPASAELEKNEDGTMVLKGSMVAQYVVTDKVPVTLVEDAYSPNRELTVVQENLMPPAILESRRENLYGEQTIQTRANVTADVQLLPDFPKQRAVEGGLELEYPGQFQVLYYGEDGRLQASNARWEYVQTIPSADNSRIYGVPTGVEVQAIPGNARIQMKAEIPVELTVMANQCMEMVTDVVPGQRKNPDPNRPSLILRRAGGSSLWDIAKASGSSMEAIRRANGLLGEPHPDQMLLIPVT